MAQSNLSHRDTASSIERICRALVHLSFAEPFEGSTTFDRPASASGLLVSLGGRDFVFTASRYVEKAEPESTSALFPGQRTARARPGQGLLSFVRAGADLDVAVIELNPGENDLWQAAEPFEPAELGSLAASVPSAPPHTGGSRPRVLSLCGFPLPERQAQRALPGVDPAQVALATIELMELAHESPARAGAWSARATQVRYSGSSWDYARKTWRAAPTRPIYGGPLAAITDISVQAVGISRDLDEQGAWCEPVVEWARLLIDHDVEEVAAAARHVVSAVEFHD